MNILAIGGLYSILLRAVEEGELSKPDLHLLFLLAAKGAAAALEDLIRRTLTVGFFWVTNDGRMLSLVSSLTESKSPLLKALPVSSCLVTAPPLPCKAFKA